KAKTLLALVLAHQSEVPRPLNEVRPDVPPELAAVAAKMLAKEPAQRYQKPSEIAQAILPFIKAGAKAMPAVHAPGEPPAESLVNTPAQANIAPQTVPGIRPKKPGAATVSHHEKATANDKRPRHDGKRTSPARKKGLPSWLWVSAGLGGGLCVLAVLAIAL